MDGSTGPKRYSVGTLTYTTMGLVSLCAWLSWGSACFSLMSHARPSALQPLLLMGHGGIGASTTATFVLLVMIPRIITAIVGPIVGCWSDRHRGPRGRRIPFIMWGSPFVALTLVVISFVPTFKGLFDSHGTMLGLSPVTTTVIAIGVCVALFYIVDEFVTAVSLYLYVDVVPERLLARFLWVTRTASMLMGGLLARYVANHMHWVALGSGLLYVIGIQVMCRFIKEGEYPPPDDWGDRPSVAKKIGVYFRECFSHRLYLLLYAEVACMAIAVGASFSSIIFFRDGIGLTLSQINHVMGIAGGVGIGLGLFAAWAVDKYHPLRIALIVQVPLVAMQLYAFMFVRDLTTFIALQAISVAVLTLHEAARGPLLMRLLPRDKFGQFGSCAGLVTALAMMAGGLAGGAFMDTLTNDGVDKFAFRWMYLWFAAFQALAFVFLLAMYRKWTRLGGDKGYVAPGSALARQAMAATVASTGDSTGDLTDG